MTPTRPRGRFHYRTSVSLEPVQWDTLDKLAKQRDCSVSKLIRQAVDEFLARRPREVERALGDAVAV